MIAQKPDAPKKATVVASEDRSEVAKALQMRRDVLRWGVEMLPESKSAGKGPSQDVAARELTHWLDLPPGTFALPANQRKEPNQNEDDDE